MGIRGDLFQRQKLLNRCCERRLTDVTEHCRRVAQRSRAFYAARGPGHFLVGVSFPVESPPTPPLFSLDLERQLGEWLDRRLAMFRPRWAAKAGIDDDVLPAMYPRYGVAEHSAWLGLDVRLQEDTALSTPAVETLGDVEQLVFSDQTPWYRTMRRSYEHLRRRQDGTFLLGVRGTMSPMDLANAVRGDGLFEDFLLRPEFVHRLLRRMTDAIRWYYPQLLSWADEIDGGHIISGFAWMGPRCIGHLSNDAAMLCSARVYEEFGFPYEQKVVDGYPQVFFHVHSQQMHYVPQLSRLPGLALLEVTQDPKTPPVMENLRRIFSATGAAPLALTGTSQQVRAHIEELKERNCFLLVTCADRKDAETTLEFVRGHSKPLE